MGRPAPVAKNDKRLFCDAAASCPGTLTSAMLPKARRHSVDSPAFRHGTLGNRFSSAHVSNDACVFSQTYCLPSKGDAVNLC